MFSFIYTNYDGDTQEGLCNIFSLANDTISEIHKITWKKSMSDGSLLEFEYDADKLPAEGGQGDAVQNNLQIFDDLMSLCDEVILEFGNTELGSSLEELLE